MSYSLNGGRNKAKAAPINAMVVVTSTLDGGE